MKKKIILGSFLVVFMIGIHFARAQQPIDSLKNQLCQFLNQWHLDAAEGNHRAYIGAMTDDGVFIGTDATEYWTTAEFSAWCKPYFEKKRTWNFKTISRNIYTGDNGLTAWFDELLDTQMGICRGSGVLIRIEGKWKISQYVLSTTIPNEVMRKVTAQKKSEDSLLIPYLTIGIRDPEKSMGLKVIFDKYGMNGTILVFDPATREFAGYNPSSWDSGYLPASTFKIVNTLIGFETGAIDTDYIFKWNGEKRRLPQWEKDLTLEEAFRFSCVPCYQELARMIGPDRMKSSLEKMMYPGMDVHTDNIDLFWLEGDSRITPRQQVEFIRKLYNEQLPLKPTTMQAVKAIMLNEVTPDYRLSGKTGWAIRNGNNYGWFVGWVETKAKVYFVATLVEPKDQKQVEDFAAARKLITMGVFRWLGLIPGDNPDIQAPGL
jgi:beta-lactamase class D